jgi:hypothetical protein
MDWLGLLAIITTAWCGIDIGIAIERKNTNSIIFNAIIILFEAAFIFFRTGI